MGAFRLFDYPDSQFNLSRILRTVVIAKKRFCFNRKVHVAFCLSRADVFCTAPRRLARQDRTF